MWLRGDIIPVRTWVLANTLASGLSLRQNTGEEVRDAQGLYKPTRIGSHSILNVLKTVALEENKGFPIHVFTVIVCKRVNYLWYFVNSSGKANPERWRKPANLTR
jgi:hypothetical protein